MKRIMLIWLLPLFSVMSVEAQNPSAPLMMIIDANLWAWNEGDAAPRQLTQSGFVQEMSLSPDGRQLAFTQLPQVVIDAIQREGGFGGGALPTDIWVMDIASGNTSQIATQPPDASFAAGSTPDKVVVRARPVWSPDSKQLAWTEYDDASLPQQLVVYDFSSGAASTIVSDIEPPYGVPAPVPMLGWANSGIVLWNVLPVAGNTAQSQDVFEVYAADGKQVSRTVLPVSSVRFLTGVILLTDSNHEAVGMRYNTGEWDLVDVSSGQIQPAMTVPAIYSVTQPDPSVSVVQNSPGVSEPTALQMLDAQGNALGGPIPVGHDMLGSVAMSPDGQTIAFRQVNGQNQAVDPFVTLWRAGESVGAAPLPTQDQTPYLQSYVWGSTAWRLSTIPIVLAPPTPVFECAGALPTRLAVGNLAQVTVGGEPNNLRDTASLGGVVIGQIPEGGVFSISNGPVCADGLVWFQTTYNGQTGWTVEGQNGVYYLELVQ